MKHVPSVMSSEDTTPEQAEEFQSAINKVYTEREIYLAALQFLAARMGEEEDLGWLSMTENDQLVHGGLEGPFWEGFQLGISAMAGVAANYLEAAEEEEDTEVSVDVAAAEEAVARIHQWTQENVED